eukprot:CAMPEP_0114521282 /NCGR_PEP_ID=MMETSP0109-20121206/20097_1 /TAXON_ID=29199 /ORGANISM="Chlorarachnion reptans, Strain CCCM449" /LENGTH=76 /DNA_ID=CAMNT_0001702365 /DNA_START=1028 /DNA_END=1258 /DNA_ORIENTATION=-
MTAIWYALLFTGVVSASFATFGKIYFYLFESAAEFSQGMLSKFFVSASPKEESVPDGKNNLLSDVKLTKPLPSDSS